MFTTLQYPGIHDVAAYFECRTRGAQAALALHVWSLEVLGALTAAELHGFGLRMGDRNRVLSWQRERGPSATLLPMYGGAPGDEQQAQACSPMPLRISRTKRTRDLHVPHYYQGT